MWGFFRDTGDEQDVGSTLKRSEDSQKSREHRSTDNLHSDRMPPTVIDTYNPGLSPLVRRGGFWPLGHSSPIRSPFHNVFGYFILDMLSFRLK